ncbi:group II intron reverse transcriptase/maturase [Klebsiella pneumoniae]|uniref:group II intron reverse transcriptase/maturase n=1 Tax=Klebsiella pneumoniae TaxID=573 RepID=UPI0022DDA115|nr:group II intron reverse transcriptase/maturase [Klebsiella pneumoniae]
MYGEEKSDSLIVAGSRRTTRKERSQWSEGAGAKGNAEQPHMRRTQSRESMSQRLSRVREAAKQRKKERFTALFHLLTVEALEAAFLSLSRKAAAGVDGIRWMDYAGNMKNNITDLHRRLHQGSYRAQPGRRHYIPKADGKQRPLGIASLEDKIVQYALVKILNAVYENDFMGFSYGFRPGRSQHDALDAPTGLVRTNVNWVLDADISQFFDRVSHEWLIRFTEHRIGDRRVIRLIRKWLTAGTSEEGQWRATEEGTPTGAVISPLLANIYLHYVFDLWAHQWRRRYATGNVVMVRYADDIVIGFDKRYDARRFRIAMQRRLREFGLTVHPEKTRLMEFGRFAAENRAIRGKANQKRSTSSGSRTSAPTMQKFRTHVTNLWRRALRRRSQKDDTTWTKANKLAAAWLPRVRVLHPWPVERFTARHPRQEPGA